MSKRGILIVLSGFSGSGKGTVVKELLKDYKNYALSISATTRQPREGEEEGVSYFFKSMEEFEQMIAEDRFIEYAKYVDNYYGTPREYVEQQLTLGMDVILEIDEQGALDIQKQYHDAVLIFLTPPTAVELEQRLVNRKTEDDKTIARRMSRAYEESQYMNKYDYVVINKDIAECARDIHGIIVSEHVRSSRQYGFIHNIEEQLREYSKGE